MKAIEIFEQHTKHQPCVVPDEPNAQTVWLVLDHQSFQIGEYVDSEEHAVWIRHQLATALQRLSTGDNG